ncbi:MAG: cobalt ECF transporter T component CbiQ [Desulfobacterales bacterium]|nr:cobalt ECF transporter T component CbiQ [Desulfobacterales bacterium]
MTKIDKSFSDIGYMDTLSSGDTFLHRLDPRAKLITTLIYIVMVISYDKYSVSALIPFFIYPLVQISLGDLSVKYILKKVLLVSPFAVFIGIFNPLLDRDILFQIWNINISGGWISFFSIMLRFVLTVSSCLILIALTGFNGVCTAIGKLGVPKVFVVQLLFLYRYIFVLTDQSVRMVRAKSLRSFNSNTMDFKTFVSLVGHLLLRTMDRAQRIYLAMCCRGFDGYVPMIRPLKMGYREIGFTLGWSVLFILLRYFNLPLNLGLIITGFFS